MGTVSSETSFGTLHLLAARVTRWGERRSHRRDNAAQRPIRGGENWDQTPESRFVGWTVGELVAGASGQGILRGQGEVR